MKIAMFNAHINDAVRQTGKTRQEILSQLSQMGVTALEYGIQELDDIEAVKEELAMFNMEICSIFEHCHFEIDDTVDYRIVDVADELGVDKLLIVPGFLRDNIAKDEVMTRCVNGLRSLIEYAKTKNITVTIEPFDSNESVMPDIASLLYFGEALNELKYTFDTGNFIYSGEDELEAFEILVDRIVHVHLKDRTSQVVEGADPTVLPNKDKVYASSVGAGMIQMPAILDRLNERGYQGYLTIEHFGASNYLQTMYDSVSWLNQKLNK